MVGEKKQRILFLYIFVDQERISTQEQFLFLGNWLEFPETPRNAFSPCMERLSTNQHLLYLNDIKWSLYGAFYGKINIL